MLASIKNKLSEQAAGFLKLSYLESVSSTNEIIRAAISAKEPEGTAVIALQQTGGYGRQGRYWKSPVGGIYVSLLLRPVQAGRALSEAPTLSLVLSLAVKHTLHKLGCRVPLSVKWPNDVLCDQGKLCGISLEAIDGALCIGLGLNLLMPNEKQTLEGKYVAAYASVIIQDDNLCHTVSPEGLTAAQKVFFENAAACLLSEVVSAYNQWLVEGFSSFREEYRASSALQGKSIQLVSQTNGILYEGTVQDVDIDGCLCLRTEQDEVVRAHSGEVHIVKNSIKK